MKKYILLENSFRGKRIEKKVFSYCLFRQPSLIRFLPLYILYDLLHFFGIFNRQKYSELRWSFLSSVNALDERLNGYFAKNVKRFFLPSSELCVLSDAPGQVMSAFSLVHGVEAIGNECDAETKKYTDFRKAADMIPDGEEYEAYGTAFSPIMKRAAVKTYLYGKRKFRSRGGCIAAISAHYAFAYILMVAASIAVGFASLWWAAEPFEDRATLFASYFKVPYILLVNIIPVVVLTLLLYYLFNNPGVAFGVSSTVTLVCTWVSYYKVLFRNDPFMVSDFGLIMEAGNMADKYKIVIRNRMILTIAIVFLVSVILAVFFRCKTNIRLRTVIVVALAVGSVWAVKNVYLSEDVYYNKTKNPDIVMVWSETENFRFRGFIYPFINSAKSISTVPEGYNKHEAEQILAGYTDDIIPEDKHVNVIAVMLEAFSDFSRFDCIDFDIDPFEKFHNICDESYSGNLITDIFAGGTVRTERNFITAASNLYPFRKKSNSYAWYFRENGYTVEGSHPSYDWFYNRVNINENLGFENYYFDDDTYMELNYGYRVANNDILFPNVVKLMKEALDRGEDYFSFNVTYQGHGPYATDTAEFNKEYVSQDEYSDYSYYVLNNYFALTDSVCDSIEALTEDLRSNDEPVVLIMFGDHMPWLGDNNSVYEELGINFDLSTDEGFLNYYTTPYFIWANDSAKDVLGNDFKGEGPTIGSYFLMNEFFRLAGYGGNQYTKFTADIEKEFHVIHSTGICFDADGNICRDLTPEQEESVSRYQKVQYYYMNNFKN